MKQRTIITVLFLIVADIQGMAQQPVLSVQSFEYIRDVEAGKNKYWLNIPEAGWIKDSMRKSFSVAIYQRWKIAMPEAALSSKALGFFSNKPKFNTKLKDKQPNTWYMFLQVFNQRNPAFSFYDTAVNLAITLQLRCRIINGDNDSLVHDRNLTIEVFSEPVPASEVALTKLPAHPTQFIQAFDSIATWLFSTDIQSITKSIKLKPACAFSEPPFNYQPLAQFEFASSDTSIHLVTPSLFSFKTPGPQYRKLTKKKNTGGNTATGAITLLTGLNIDKSKVNNYSADFLFVTDKDSLHCIINYWEMKVAERERTKEKDSNGNNWYSMESGGYYVAQRGTDSSYLNSITLGADTITSFTITYLASNERSNYKRLWDGTDSSTILPLPAEWNNDWANPNLLIKGTMQGNDFMMQSLRSRAIRNFFINDQLALSVYGRTLPVKALQFQQLSPIQIKLFTILSSLPYSYFNYSTY